MFYLALSRVNGSYAFDGAVTRPDLIDALARMLHASASAVSVDGSTVLLGGMVVGTLTDVPPLLKPLNARIGRIVREVIRNADGDDGANLRFVASEIAAHARYRRGFTRAQFLNVMSQLYDEAVDE